MAIANRIGPRALAELLAAAASPPVRPQYRWLAESIGALLLDGRIAPETLLPSERDLARQLGLSRTTTSAAYRSLAESGLLASRRGSGSALRLPPGSRVAGLGARARPPGTTGPVLDLSLAALPADAWALADAVRAAEHDIADQARSPGYQPYGLPALRADVADWFRARGVPTVPDQILITNGAQHATVLLLRALLSPGERVLTELPCYPGALDAVDAAGGRVVAVPFAADGGWDVAALTATLRQASPRLAILMPDFQNPTGALIPTEQRAALLTAARRAGTRVIVDESFVELDLRGDPDPERPCAAVDPGVISLGSLSKPFWGGLRVGWIRAEEELVERLAAVRAQGDLSGSILDQSVGRQLLARRDVLLPGRRDELRARRDCLVTELAARLPGWRPGSPVGGLSCWVRLDRPGAAALAYRAQRLGVLLTPGSRFAPAGHLDRHLRLPFTLDAAALAEAVMRLAVAWSGTEDLPVVSAPVTPSLVPV